MTTTQFARISQLKSPSEYHHRKQSLPSKCSTVGDVVDDSTGSEIPWDPTLTINRLILAPDFDESEYVIANGHPVSPISTFPIKDCSDMNLDEPDSHQGICRTHSYDPTLFDIRKVPPEQIAAQITLLDQDKFKAIRIEEFSNCNWSKKEKQLLAPHIVAFTQQFNHTAFLVMREILNQENEKARADIISQFIKIAKKLYDMNNIHSLKAVLSALQSTPIYRLSQTWRHLTKKDRSNFEKMEDFLSDKDNWKVLREHMDGAKLPCIPHLGLYLTDLCFLNDLPNKDSQMESIVNLIAYFQNSDYGETHIVEPHVQRYLTRARYIDELQKFYEDDNYKLSLKYEPHQISKSYTLGPILRQSSITHARKVSNNKLRLSKSHEDLLQLGLEERTKPLGPESSFSARSSSVRRSLNANSKGELKLKDTGHSSLFHKCAIPSLVLPSRKDSFSFTVDVRKSVTIPNKSRAGSLGRSSFSSPSGFDKRKSQSAFDCTVKEKGVTGGPPSVSSTSPTPLNHIFPSPVSSSSTHSTSQRAVPPSPLLSSYTRGHKKSRSLGSNVLAKFGVARFSPPVMRKELSPDPHPTALSLLDESFLDDTFPITPTGSTGNASISGSSSYTSLEDVYRQFGDEESDDVSGGYLRGVSLIKDGFLKRKTLKHNGNLVSQLRRPARCLMQLTPDTLYFTDVRHSKKLLKHRDPSEKMTEEQFIINDDNGNSTRFTAKSMAGAMEWVVAIKEAIRVQEENAREEAERSLIKL